MDALTCSSISGLGVIPRESYIAVAGSPGAK